MGASWTIRVYENQRLAYSADLTGAAEVGRQSTAEESLYSHRLVGGLCRVVVAGLEEDSVSRKHVLLEPLAEGGFRVTNRSRSQRILLPDNSRLQPGDSRS